MHDVFTRSITGIFFGGLFWLGFIYLPPFGLSLVLLAIVLRILLFEWGKLFSPYRASFWLVMPIYPLLPFVLLIFMNQHPEYRELLFFLFIIVFCFDTGSYIAGSLLGRHKIMPTVSPGKTWEGFLGGYFFALISFIAMLFVRENMQPIYFILPITLGICILALAGDLFESWLKRRVRVKDAGDVLPGHGGLLDRFDSILFAVFFFYFGRYYLVRTLLT